MDSFFVNFLNQSMLMHNAVIILAICFAAGIITSLSPCSLGLLPIVVGYVGGYSDKKDNKRSLIQILFFILGLSIVLTTIGVTCAATGKVFGASQSGPIWSLLIASFILVMGLNLLEILTIPMPVIVKQMPTNKSNNLILYPLIIGGAFAFAASPCSTPVLAAIMAYSSLKANLAFGAVMLFLFSLGQGVILLIASLFTTTFKKMSKFHAVSEGLMKFSGVLLILSAFLIYAKVFQLF